VWQDWPWNVSTPEMRGIVAAESTPTAVIYKRVV
jgi:hypothetical protein